MPFSQWMSRVARPSVVKVDFPLGVVKAEALVVTATT
jgi:hypothetical protein